MTYHRFRNTCLAAATLLLVLTACTGQDDGPEVGPNGEIIITCTSCAGDAADPFLKYRKGVADAFNKEYAGEYQIEILPNVVGAGAELEQAYQRLAQADDLPDLFVHTSASLATYDEISPLMDFAPMLEDDPGFAASFYDNIFDQLTAESGKVLGIPEQRDVVGFYYNSDRLKQAGMSEPPATWDDFRTTAQAVTDKGGIGTAVDGLFVTQILLSHLIGTQEGGAEYLSSGEIIEGGFAGNNLWVTAIEYLRDLHLDSLVNEDAFTGDFQRASGPFLSGEAASITNGPWYAGDIAGEAAAPGLDEKVTYVPAPGDGVAVFGGDAAWASGASDPKSQKAVKAFIEFAYTFEEQARRTASTGSFGPIQGEFTGEQRAKLNPLTLGLVDASQDVENSYPYVGALVPSSFQDAWRNYWPAYAQGDTDTEAFLTQLSDALAG